VRLEGAMGASMAFKGTTDEEAFEAFKRSTSWRAHPSEAGADRADGPARGASHEEGAPAHRREGREARRFLPSYSEDFNPIEEAFSEVKALLKKAQARTREALLEAMSEALSVVGPEEVQGWFAHRDYGVQAQGS
jgi:hypothetical protein